MEAQTKENSAIIIDECISVDDTFLLYNKEKIALLEITALKFGWMPIRLDWYTIGSRYMLEVKTPDKKIQINLRSYLGIYKNRQYEKFNALLNGIWDLTVVRLMDQIADEINRGERVIVGKCKITNGGIWYKNFLIEWSDLSYQKNYNRLTINSKSNSAIWTNLYYTETDNAQILMYYLDSRFETE